MKASLRVSLSNPSISHVNQTTCAFPHPGKSIHRNRLPRVALPFRIQMSESTTSKDTKRICKAIKSVYSSLRRREHGLRSGTSLCAIWNVIAIGQNSSKYWQIVMWSRFRSPRLKAPQAAALAAGLRTKAIKLVILARLEVGLMLGKMLGGTISLDICTSAA